MGHQFRIFLTDADISEFERTLLTDEIAILADRSRGPYPNRVDSTLIADGGQFNLFFFLTRKQDMNSILTQHVKTQGYWAIDELRSPVIEFSLSRLVGKEFRPGRLYYNDKYYDLDGTMVEKTEGYSDWAKRFLSISKRHLNYDKELGAYLGKHALEMSKRGITFRGY